METLIIVCVCFFTVFFFVFAMFSFLGVIENPVEKRIQNIQSSRMTYEQAQKTHHKESVKKAITNLGQHIAPKNDRDRKDCKQRLHMAGFYRDSSYFFYWGARIVLSIGLPVACALLLSMIRNPAVHPILFISMSGCVGFILPDIFISFVKSRRHEQIFRGLPDALDLLVVCLESGLGLDAAMQKVSEEFHISNPELSEELRMTCASIRLGQPRNEALHDLGFRTGVMDLKTLVAVLIQADRFGTSSASALRVHASDMRTRRRQRAEELAAKTTVKLIFPLVLFIFPSIFVVLAGPAVIKIMETFVK